MTTNPASISPENHVILRAINYKWSVKHIDRLKEAISVPLHSTSDNWAIVSVTEEHPSASPGDGQYNSNSKFSFQLRTKLGLTQYSSLITLNKNGKSLGFPIENYRQTIVHNETHYSSITALISIYIFLNLFLIKSYLQQWRTKTESIITFAQIENM